MRSSGCSRRLCASAFAFLVLSSLGHAQSVTRPAPLTISELSKLTTPGVWIHEVSDYVFGNYRGEFRSPPSADENPRKAFVVTWHERPYRFVFSHEASYCPWIEFPSGAAVSFQFFEGNDGWAELFNRHGHRGYAREPIEMIGVCPVDLRWRDRAGDEEGYLAEVSLQPDRGFAVCALLPPDATSFRKAHLPPDTTCYFRVRAFVHGKPSNVASATTEGAR